VAAVRGLRPPDSLRSPLCQAFDRRDDHHVNFLLKLFGKKKPANEVSNVQLPPSNDDPANDPNMIKVFDEYGREVFLTREQWKDSVLLGNLEQKRDDPEQLYGMLVGALQDGFVADVIPYAEHLWRTDPIPSRGATVLGIVYMKTDRLEDAAKVLDEFLSLHGEDGVVLTNLAKVHSQRGDDANAESVLWRALEVDPNQDNGLDWYAAIHRDRGGETSALDAYRRVAALPGSWRALLWLARYALEGKNLMEAESLYAEVLERIGNPPPPDVLMQISGDLGNNGYLAEIIRLVEPHFDPAFHGLQVGNNLIKANLDLGQAEIARRVLNQLYAQKRPDWQGTLSYWDTELAKASITQRAQVATDQLSVSILSIEGPLWSRDGSMFGKLLPAKNDQAQRIAIFGSSVLRADAPDIPTLQLSDAAGRLSRAIPLFLTEKIHLSTDYAGVALIPWMQSQGFALLGYAYGDQEICDLASNNDEAPAFVVVVVVDATLPRWKLLLRLLRCVDGVCLGKVSTEVTLDRPGPSVGRLAEQMTELLARHTDLKMTATPPWYQIPCESDSSDYLLRLEQQLAVTCIHLDFLEGGALSGEREILDGTLQLCVRQPSNPLVRIVLAQTLRQMRKVRPDVLPEYKEKIRHLLRDTSISGDVGKLIQSSLEQEMEL
jgi:tetratricopeptide (TPR) repeat protein